MATKKAGSSSSSSGKKRKGSSAAAAVPLAPPPGAGSRKRARQVTTLFHKYTRQRDAADQNPEVQRHYDALIEQLGGRREYQRASQISTSFHSTSKWVLGYLARNGWIHGIIEAMNDDNADDGKEKTEELGKDKKRKRPERRPTQLLEIGAINTELLDAAAAEKNNADGSKKTKYSLSVRSIDLHSTHEGIEEADFLQMPLPEPQQNNKDTNTATTTYDVIVCSMVLNCVTTPAARGDMLCRLYHFLRPGGHVFLTIPKTCLNLSPFMDRPKLEQLLRAVGLTVVAHAKDSPKVAFFVASRPMILDKERVWHPKWTHQTTIRRGKKFRNEFAVTLGRRSFEGQPTTTTMSNEEGDPSGSFTRTDLSMETSSSCRSTANLPNDTEY